MMLGQKLAGQFALGRELPAERCPAELGVRTRLAGGWELATHPALLVTCARDRDRELCCLGMIYDPRLPAATQQQVVAALAACDSFGALEKMLAGLGGRYLIVAQIDRQSRLYGDACGLRSAYYCHGPGGLLVATQPGVLWRLLERTEPTDTLAQLARSSWADVFPPGVVPYAGVSQLLPNHFLDLESGMAHRFWPTQRVRERSLDDAAGAILTLLQGSLRAIAGRSNSVALAVTGGYDSRSILAAAWEIRDRFKLFTLTDMSSALHDVWLPYRLAKIAGGHCQFVWAGATTPEQVELMRSNTGRLWRDPNEHRVAAFGKVGADLMLLGNTSEVFRSGLYLNRPAPEPMDAAAVATVLGWHGDETALGAAQRWMDHVPADSGIALIDLLYWEARMGIWSALDCAGMDAFIDAASPYNCRELLEVGLGVDARHRNGRLDDPENSFVLHRRICQLGAPETLRLPFNRTWLTGLEADLKQVVPPGFRAGLKRLRKRLARASDAR